MNQARGHRQPRRGPPRALRTRLVQMSDSQKLFLDTMRQHLDETMHEARDRRDKWKFFFLKGELDHSPNQARAFEPKKAEAPQPKISKRRNRADQSETEISALQNRILEAAERLDVCAQVEQSVSDLIRLARTGNQLIVGELHSIAVTVIGALHDIAAKRPKLVRPIARRQFSWPALIGRKRFIKETNERLMERLDLGEGDTLSNRGWHFSAPSTHAAMDLFLTAQLYEEDWNLPPLAENNKRIWFEISWDQMLKEGIEPEKIPWLAPLGKSAIGKRSVSRGMPAQTDGMKRDDMRAEIKRQIWNAFEKLVAGAAEKSK
jgi:hypothetical protein